MDILLKILACQTDEEAVKIIEEEIKKADLNAEPVEQLGFLPYGQNVSLHKGFIPLKTRIKYSPVALETYGMETTDFFYEFVSFIKQQNIKNKGTLIKKLELFINNYFGYPGKNKREDIFETLAWNNTTTDEEYFQALENNKIGDLKGMGAAECTERSALAQQILSLFGVETYYCMGCVDLDTRQEAHCFNIVKRQNDYALLDYSVPVAVFNNDGNVVAYLPFVGEMSNEEFEEFLSNGTIKNFSNYEYFIDGNKQLLDTERMYVVGSFEIEKESVTGSNRS